MASHILCITGLIISAFLTNVFCEKTSVFRVVPKTHEQLNALQDLDIHFDGVEYWKEPSSLNRGAEVMIPAIHLDTFKTLIKQNDLVYEIIIPDIQQLLNNATVSLKRTRKGTSKKFGWTQFHTLDEINNWLDHLSKTYPDNVKTIVGGKSYEGREIKGVNIKFGDNKPGVFIEAGIHAREWISHTTATYLINQLLTSDDPEIRDLAESFEWYIFPSVNPDGYAYSHTDPRNPKYRLWRKTRSPRTATKCYSARFCYRETCYGADPNRNWGFRWGGPGSGKDACGETFAGSRAFSEIETKTLSQYISSLKDKLFAYISFHSFIEKLMFPYGYTTDHLDNYDEQYEVGQQALKALSKRYGTQYELGNIREALGGPASGGSVDWVKAQLKVPFVYCYELRGHTSDGRPYGFVPPPTEIIPNGQEVVDSLVALFKAARKYDYPQLKGGSE